MQVSLPPVRRVVTGRDKDGRSVVVLDDEPSPAKVGAGESTRTVVEVWATTVAGTDVAREKPARSETLGLNATEIRVVDIPPGARREMHRTDTIDYGIVAFGEVYLVLESSERLLQCGDIVVQRGTLHSWQNRSESVARLVFVNMSGQETDRARCPSLESGT